MSKPLRRMHASPGLQTMFRDLSCGTPSCHVIVTLKVHQFIVNCRAKNQKQCLPCPNRRTTLAMDPMSHPLRAARDPSPSRPLLPPHPTARANPLTLRRVSLWMVLSIFGLPKNNCFLVGELLLNVKVHLWTSFLQGQASRDYNVRMLRSKSVLPEPLLTDVQKRYVAGWGRDMARRCGGYSSLCVVDKLSVQSCVLRQKPPFCPGVQPFLDAMTETWTMMSDCVLTA